MAAPHRVLFVCTGNTCRSPMAEALFRKAVQDREDFSVKSAGVAAWPGSPASGETVQIVQHNDASLDGFSSQAVDQDLINEATHVFCMTRSHKGALLANFPEAESKVFLTCDFLVTDGEVGHDVPDPIGMGMSAYQAVADVFEAAIPTLVSYIDQTTSKD